jgi:hypothetical protein
MIFSNSRRQSFGVCSDDAGGVLLDASPFLLGLLMNKYSAVGSEKA